MDDSQIAGGYIAPRGFMQQAQMNIRPEFEVHKLEGTVKKEIRSYEKIKDDDTGKVHFELRVKTIEEDAGYIVYCAHGHSFRVKTDAELKRLGLHRQPGLIDMNNLEMLPGQNAYSLAMLNQAMSQARAGVQNIPAEVLKKAQVVEDDIEEVSYDADD